jgi:hypothetical protein
MRTLPLLALNLFLFSSQYLLAGSPAKVQNLIHPKEWNFVENKGQLIEDKDPDHVNAKYYSHSGGAYIYCKPGSIHFEFIKNEKDNINAKRPGTFMNPGEITSINSLKDRRSSEIKTQHIDLVFTGSNPDAEITASDQLDYYENYYLAKSTGTNPDAGTQITFVHCFKTITYKNIYPDIDMALHTMAQGIKYEFIIYPGGNVKDIQMQWDGLNEMTKTEGGGILYRFATGTLQESAPLSFTAAEHQHIESHFILQSNTTGFEISGYDKTKTIVIDPALKWCTLFGGNGADIGVDMTTDYNNNVYICGWNTVVGFLAKFNSSGSRLWSNYYSIYQSVLGVATDATGTVYITGDTYSKTGLATTGTYQTSYGGGNDAFISNYNGSGMRLWSTYYGGSESEQGRKICLDPKGNIFIAGLTGSTAGIASSGAYQTAFGGKGTNGLGDAFVAKFSGSGSFLWGTYLGGSDDDYAFGIAADSSGNAFVSGYTKSTSGVASSGAFQTSYAGGYQDGFLAKFTKNGALQWSTYYGGNSNDDCNHLAVDLSGNVYIVGSTSSTSGIASTGAFSTKLTGINNAFLAKFSNSGSRLWSTYFGPYEEYGNSVSLDKYGNPYICGVTYSAVGLSTSGAYQKSSAGYYDAFISNFDINGKLKMATYFGTKGDDEAFGIAVDKVGSVYITGYTDSLGLATSGAYQTSLAGGYSDAFLAKFNFVNTDAGIDSIKNPTGSFCAGAQNIKVRLKNFGTKEIDSVMIGWSINNTVSKPYKWKGKLKSDSSAVAGIASYLFSPGKDTMRVWTYAPNSITDSVPGNDTAMIVFTVNPSPVPKPGSNAAICYGNSQSIGSSSVTGHTYSWKSNPTGFTSTGSNSIVYPSSTTTYILTETITATGCSASDSVKITVNNLPAAVAGNNKAICAGQTAGIGGTTVAGDTYKWTSYPVGYSSANAGNVVSPGTTTTYYLLETNSSAGCSKTDSVKITVNPIPIVKPGAPKTICEGTAYTLGASAISGHAYNWQSKPAGFTATTSNPTVTPSFTTVYYLTETISATGCQASDSMKVTVNPAPKVNAGKDQTVCQGTKVMLGDSVATGHTYSWTSIPSGFTSAKSNPTVSPAINTNYILLETIVSTGCSKSDSVVISVNPLPLVNTGKAQSICSGQKVALGSSSSTGFSYSWTSRPTGFSASISNPADSPKITRTYYLAVKNLNTGCENTDSVTITVNPLPDPGFFINHFGNITYLHARDSSLSGASYQWKFGDGDSSTGHLAKHLYPKNKTYPVKLFIISAAGCKSLLDSNVAITVSGVPSDQKGSFSFTVFPNPFNTSATIRYQLMKRSDVSITLSDMTGKELGTIIHASQFPGAYQTEINPGNYALQPGMYLLKFRIDDGIITKQIIKF